MNKQDVLHHATKKQHRVYPYAALSFALGDSIYFPVYAENIVSLNPDILMTIRVKVAHFTT